MIEINLLRDEQVIERLARYPSRWNLQRMRDRYRRVFLRSRGQCAYCGTIEGPFEVDHIVPFIRGGNEEIDNLTLACKPCNRRKSYKTAAEFGRPDLQTIQPTESYRSFCQRWWDRW